MVKTQREQKNFKGNFEHLDILLYAIKKNTIGFWNDWREKKHDVTIVLTGANLSSANLAGADFREVILRETDLSNADLSVANLFGADLGNADLSEASLEKATLSNALLHGTYLYNTNLSEAVCIEAVFTNANLKEANLKGARLDSAVLQSTDLTNTELSNCSLVKARCDGVTFTGAHIYAWKIKEWKTNNLHCDYIYIDASGKERLPQSRKFRTGEFEGYIKKLHATKEVIKRTVPGGRALNHAFISYTKDDSDYANKLAHALEIHGINIWLDKVRLQPGILWQRAIKDAIENGMYFIACFSKNYCRQLETTPLEELKIVLERLHKSPTDKAWFVPIKILRCDIPDIKIEAGLPLKNLQWIDLSQGWNEGIKKIVERIKG